MKRNDQKSWIKTKVKMHVRKTTLKEYIQEQ